MLQSAFTSQTNGELRMTDTPYSMERDLREAQAMADGLVPYVHEDRLYGNVGGGGLFGGGTMPSLTIGSLLMRLRRLNALADQLTPAQRQTLASIEAQHEAVRKEWTVHYHEKLAQEATSRLKAMETFFEECEDNPRTCASNYQPEVLRRTIVEEVRRALEAQRMISADLDALTRKIDGKLRGVVKPSEFVWAKALEPAYPPSEYWWLYAKPPKPEEQ
jgi:hypothetical protein